MAPFRDVVVDDVRGDSRGDPGAEAGTRSWLSRWSWRLPSAAGAPMSFLVIHFPAGYFWRGSGLRDADAGGPR
jgi:hypothetical protein